MVAIHAVHYNFARIHKTLGITPSMAAGLTDHVWSLEEIVLSGKLGREIRKGDAKLVEENALSELI